MPGERLLSPALRSLLQSWLGVVMAATRLASASMRSSWIKIPYPVRILDISDIEDDVIVEEDVPVILRDGTRLSARVFRPNDAAVYPVVMAFTA